MKLALCLPFLLATPCYADTLSCRADYDESSHYELTAPLGEGQIGQRVALRYVTEDGLDLHADLSRTRQAFEAGGNVAFAAENDSMGVTLKASYKPRSGQYLGEIGITFDLEHADPLALSASCELR